MSKKALLMLPISLIVMSTASCSWFFTARDYTAEYNPERLLDKRLKSTDSHSVNYNGYEFKKDVVEYVINKAESVAYTYLDNTPDLNDGLSFKLSLCMPSLWAPSYNEITFYESGYAVTGRYDYSNEKGYTYYYEFDKKVAKAMCAYVDYSYKEVKEQERKEKEERDRVESEYNEMIQDMTIFTLIEKMHEEEKVDLQFFFVTQEDEPRYYDFTFKDDGSIYTALKNAEYSTFDQRIYEEDALLANLNIRGREWSIGIDRKSRGVIASFETKDKYNRNYSKRIEKTIDVDSINTIMNRAYELSTPTNPFGNSSSNPSSSSEE